MKNSIRLSLILVIICVFNTKAQDSLIQKSLDLFDLPIIQGKAEKPHIRFGTYLREIQIDSLLAQRLKIKEQKAFFIWHVMPGSTADIADIYIGDTLLYVNGSPIYDKSNSGDDYLDNLLYDQQEGEEIAITLIRDESLQVLKAKLKGYSFNELPCIDPGLGQINTDSWLNKTIKKLKQEDVIDQIQRQMRTVANTDYNRIAFSERPNPFRLNAVTYLHKHPTRVGAYSRLITDELWSSVIDTPDLSDLIKCASKHLDVRQVDYILLGQKPNNIEQLSEYIAIVANSTDIAYRSIKPNLDEVISKLKPLLELEESDDSAANKGLTKSQIKSMRMRQDADKARIMGLADKVDLFALTDAARMLCALADTAWLRDFVSNLNLTEYDGNVKGVDGKVLFYSENEFGRLVIGGSGNNKYYGDFAVIIDIGGNDLYDLPPAKYGNVRFVADLSGDDSYLSKFNGIASGVGCVDVLVDCEGNDTYRAELYSEGAALLGVGVLADFAGNDVYTAKGISQGAAFLGIGILFDNSGDDLYDSKVYSQGFGYVKGMGILMDHKGNDSYKAGWWIKDYRDPKRAFLSMSQGYGYGMRPWGSALGADGGIGVLTDFEGHDIYSSDFFSQGGSYWYSLGILHDYKGCDRYTAGQYSQGSGIHLSFGALLDDEGNDMYDAYAGLEQGNAHDWSAGCLEDQEGDDTYRGYGSSQGSALTVAVAYLFDGQGNDMYIIKPSDTTYSQGGGRKQASRRASSLGILFDAGKGQDVYTEPRVKPGEAVLKGQNGIIFDDGELSPQGK